MLVFTDGLSRRLKRPLAAWVNFNFNQWTWFLSEDQQELFSQQDGVWKVYHRLHTST